MKNIKFLTTKITALAALSLIIVGCDRELSDEAEFATFSTNGDVFIDAFSSGLDYFPFVQDGADPKAYNSVTDEVFDGASAMRLDVPAFGNGFLGATFNTTANRDLSGYDALTFYAKASQAATINNIGFGISAETRDQHKVTLQNLAVSTNWKKYVIPIPDPSKLTNETGLFWLTEGASSQGDEGGYILWFDEIKFEKLGTVAQPRPRIFNGQDLVEQSFTGSTLTVSGLTQTLNIGNGSNVTVAAAPSYFSFVSSDNEVARVSERGEITVVGEGTATITAVIGGVLAEGSVEITSTGGLSPAPVPTRQQADVLSIFSDAYTNAATANFSPGFGRSTTQTSIATFNNDNVAIYLNNNFTGIMFDDNPVNASDMAFMHVDVYIQDVSTSSIEFQIRDIGTNGVIDTDVNNGNAIGDDKDFRFTATGLTAGQWTSFEIPLSGGIATQKSNLGAIILVGGTNFILDNIYFYKE